MGLINFIRNVGKRLTGASEAQAAPASELTKEVQSHGFDTTNMQINVDGGKVSVAGEAKSQEEAERIILALGNTVGVDAVENKLIVTAENKAAPEKAATMYTVKKGDTLWKIAENHYGKGHGVDYTKIVAANNPPITNPDLIQPGWVLRIPQ